MSFVAFIPVIIGLLVLLVAYVLYQVATEILEEGEHFWTAIGGFFVLYVVAAVGIYFLVAHPENRPDIAGTVRAFFTILPSQLEQGAIKQ